MATWGALDTATQRILSDTFGEIHDKDVLRKYLEAAELLVGLFKGYTETTGDLSLSANTPLYEIHDTFSDFIVPLRVTIDNTVLGKTSLQALGHTDPNWQETTGTPESWFMIGATLLGFYPTPSSSLTATVTYLRVPPTGVADAEGPVLPDEWHLDLTHYAAALAFAAEGKLDRAQEELNQFVVALGVRDPRFLAGSKQRPPTQGTDEAVKVGTD